MKRVCSIRLQINPGDSYLIERVLYEGKKQDLTLRTREDEPVSVFMAGSPGAVKTEASIELLA